MKLFVQREETDDKVIIRFPPWPLYAFWLCMVVTVIAHDWFNGDGKLRGTASVGLWIALAILATRWWFTREEERLIRAEMKSGSVSISGSRWSPADPLTYTFARPDSARDGQRTQP